MTALVLELVDLHRPAHADRHEWAPPFDRSVEYTNRGWWVRAPHHVDSPWYVQVLEEGREVARVEIDDPGGINQDYGDVPDLGDERLEIQLIEVVPIHRRRGVATAVIRALEARHPDRRLFAYSELADGFWDSLGWERFGRNDRLPAQYQPLFIQPARAVRT